MAERNAHVHPIFRDIINDFAGIARVQNAQIVAKYRYRRPPGECASCDKYGDDPMFPSHTASDRCESGKRPHCTCDTCF